MGTALLIIDVQAALCSGDEVVHDAERVLATINRLSTRAREAGVPVIQVQHEEGSGAFQFDSPGWQLAEGLLVDATDIRVRKTTPDSFHKTDLTQQLQARGIDRLVVCGLQSDFCVDTSTRRALALGYEVALAADAHSTVDNGVLSAAQIIAHHNVTLGNMTSFGKRARITPGDEIRFDA
ncbi:MAG: cysteine hydrolase family protein [Pseudomonas sp.]|uniref:cysteine hydrolase family protein n=1 Tax=Pseudomonas sp. TaxID=306 RepID=UPI003D13C18B